VLGVVFFIIGPLPSLVLGDQVSCNPSMPYVSNAAIIEGDADTSTSWCIAQRCAPFVVQLIFNMLFYVLMRLNFIVSPQFQRAGARKQRAAKAALYFFSFGYPIACLIAAMATDKLSDSDEVAPQQMLLSSAVCSLRLDADTVFVLVSLPLVLTGALIVAAAAYAWTRVRNTREKAAQFQATRAERDDRVDDLILRLGFAGLATLAIVVVYLITSSLSTSQINAYGGYFALLLQCATLDVNACSSSCQPEKNAAESNVPQPQLQAVEYATLALIPLMVATFFASQAGLRLLRDVRTGQFRKRWRRVLGQNTSSAVPSVQPNTTERNPGSNAHFAGFDGTVLSAYNAEETNARVADSGNSKESLKD